MSVREREDDSAAPRSSASVPAPAARNPRRPRSSAAEPYARRPHCDHCRIHGVVTALKGHKRQCRWRDCECDKCMLMVEKKELMHMKIGMRIERAKEENGRYFPFFSAAIVQPEASPRSGEQQTTSATNFPSPPGTP